MEQRGQTDLVLIQAMYDSKLNGCFSHLFHMLQRFYFLMIQIG